MSGLKSVTAICSGNTSLESKSAFTFQSLAAANLRLCNGSGPNEGIVEEYSAEFKEWINFCVDGWDALDARVVCRNLGFPDAAFGLSTNSAFRVDSEAYYAVSVECDGSENRLVDCKYTDLPDCSLGFGASVVCQKPDYIGCFQKPNNKSVLIEHALYSNSLTVDACIRHCREGEFDYAWTFDGVQCGCGHRSVVMRLSKTQDVCRCPCGGDKHQTCGGPDCGQGTGQFMSLYKTNYGFCPDPGSLAHGDRSGNWFRYGAEVTFTCKKGYGLHGNGTLQCVTGQKPGEFVWSHAVPSCQGGKSKHTCIEETTISTVLSNVSSAANSSFKTTPSTGDAVNLSRLSGNMVGVIAAVPATIVFIGAIIAITLVRKRRKRYTIPAGNSVRYNFQMKSPPPPRPVPVAPARRLTRPGSMTLPVRKMSSNSNDYYASIDLHGEADYENIARRKFDSRSCKEVFAPLYGSQSLAHTRIAVSRTLQGRGQRRRDPYEDTTIMVDNDLYASRDEFPVDEKPKPPARKTVPCRRKAKAFAHPQYLPEESTLG
ncbi:uncharacterized protein [Diadema antillarum]|uniref:uncharacterized protein n=1 Tax=Diadema antillarum TaxID=105358 RepID=UPI003A8351F7